MTEETTRAAYLAASAEVADEASEIKAIGCRAWRQAPISKGSSSAPSNRRVTPGRTKSLLSASSDSPFGIDVGADSSIGLVAASYTGLKAYDLQIKVKYDIRKNGNWDQKTNHMEPLDQN